MILHFDPLEQLFVDSSSMTTFKTFLGNKNPITPEYDSCLSRKAVGAPKVDRLSRFLIVHIAQRVQCGFHVSRIWRITMYATDEEVNVLKNIISKLSNGSSNSNEEIEFFSDMNQMFENLKARLRMSAGPIDEGTKDNQNRVGTGSVVSWNTYPGEIYVNPHSENEKDYGSIAYHFSGRERKADYVLGSQRDTNDTQASGRVVAEYDISRRGTVTISEHSKEGGRGRVGDAVANHVRSLNGQNVG